MWSGSNGTSEPSQTKSENQSLVKEEGRLRDHDGMDQSILNRSGETFTMVQLVDQHLNKYGKPTQWWLTMNAEENFYYWISNC